MKKLSKQVVTKLSIATVIVILLCVGILVFINIDHDKEDDTKVIVLNVFIGVVLLLYLISYHFIV